MQGLSAPAWQRRGEHDGSGGRSNGLWRENKEPRRRLPTSSSSGSSSGGQQQQRSGGGSAAAVAGSEALLVFTGLGQ